MESKFMKLLIDCLIVISLITSASVSAKEDTHSHHQSSQLVEPFDEKTWPLILSNGPQPAAYLFTTSYCSTCPAAFKSIALAAQKSKTKPQVAVVMMDVEGEQAMRHAHHFKGLNKLYAFDGYEPSIRHAIDPTWQNITPYIVLIDQHGVVSKSIGAPSAKALQAWLK